MDTFLRKLIVPACGILVCVIAAFFTVRPPAVASVTPPMLRPLHFHGEALNSQPPDARTTRQVAPALQDISAWISAVGAAVALLDADGSGASDEACLVDPRDDSVVVKPVPGSSSTYAAQLLELPGPKRPGVAPMGCLPADLDEDGDEDIIVYYWGRVPALFINTDSVPQWKYAPLTAEGEIWNTTALNAVDIDSDGHLDILVGNYFPDGSRILDPGAEDDDRIQMQDGMALARNGGTNRILLTTPQGRDEVPSVRDASTAFPKDSATSWTLAFGAQDLTHNGKPDLYVANDFGPDQLLVNESTPGNVRLTTVNGIRDMVTPKSLVMGRDSFKGMGVAFTSPENQADPAIVVSNITTPFGLQESNFFFEPQGSPEVLLDGQNPYRQNSEGRNMSRSGWAWDIKSGDFTNSGTEQLIQATGFVRGSVNRWPELQELAMSNDTLLHNPGSWMSVTGSDDLSGHETNKMFQRQADGSFIDVAPLVGFDSDTPGRGFAVGDVNRDGHLDVLVANQWADSRAFINAGSTPGESVILNLRIPGKNGGTRAAIGANVTLNAGSGSQHRQLFPANGHAGVSWSGIHFGLGELSASEMTAEVSWTDTAGLHKSTVNIHSGSTTLVLTTTGAVTSK